MTQAGVWPGTRGDLPWVRVRVEEVVSEEGYALCRDEYGKERTVALLTSSRGLLPRVGERWIVTRQLGQWTFAVNIETKPHEIVGSNDDVPALKNLLAALEEMGLIIDSTTTDRIRATTPHTHSNPEGGSTGTDTPV